jgi:hypothetical protein
MQAMAIEMTAASLLLATSFLRLHLDSTIRMLMILPLRLRRLTTRISSASSPAIRSARKKRSALSSEHRVPAAAVGLNRGQGIETANKQRTAAKAALDADSRARAPDSPAGAAKREPDAAKGQPASRAALSLCGPTSFEALQTSTTRLDGVRPRDVCAPLPPQPECPCPEAPASSAPESRSAHRKRANPHPS